MTIQHRHAISQGDSLSAVARTLLEVECDTIARSVGAVRVDTALSNRTSRTHSMLAVFVEHRCECGHCRSVIVTRHKYCSYFVYLETDKHRGDNHVFLV